MPIYFVVYFESLNWEDPTSVRGTDSFLSKEGAEAFIKVWSNKGYTCHLFEGKLLSTTRHA